MGEKRLPARPTKSATSKQKERSKSAPASKLPPPRTKSTSSTSSKKDKLKRTSYHSVDSDLDDVSISDDDDHKRRQKRQPMRKLRERPPSREVRADKQKKEKKKKDKKDRGRSRGNSYDSYDEERERRRRKKKKKRDKKKKESSHKRRSSRSADPSTDRDKSRRKDKRQEEPKKQKKERARSVDKKKLKKLKRDKSKDKTRTRSTSTSGDRKKPKQKAQRVCCICNDKDIKELAGGLCDHCFCGPCVESLLHKPPTTICTEDGHLWAPTLGRCPQCHSELRKFELKNVSKGKKKKSKKKGTPLFYRRQANLQDAPMTGLVFRPDDTKQLLCDFHFNDPDNRPYMDFTRTIDQDPEQWLLNDGTSVPAKRYFEDGSFYDTTTRTFHGTIRWNPISFQGSHRWDVVLAFSKDFSSIHVGIIHERKERILDKKARKLASKSAKKKKSGEHRYLYPFDGQWKLYWKTEDGDDQTGNITVRDNGFNQGPHSFNLSFKDPTTPKFRWPLDPVYAVTKVGGNLKRTPKGPDIGERIVWETTHPAFSEIMWERLTIGERPIQKVILLGVGGHAYSPSPDEPKVELRSTIFGSKTPADEMNGGVETSTYISPSSTSKEIEQSSMDDALQAYIQGQANNEKDNSNVKILPTTFVSEGITDTKDDLPTGADAADDDDASTSSSTSSSSSSSSSSDSSKGTSKPTSVSTKEVAAPETEEEDKSKVTAKSSVSPQTPVNTKTDDELSTSSSSSSGSSSSSSSSSSSGSSSSSSSSGSSSSGSSSSS